MGDGQGRIAPIVMSGHDPDAAGFSVAKQDPISGMDQPIGPTAHVHPDQAIPGPRGQTAAEQLYTPQAAVGREGRGFWKVQPGGQHLTLKVANALSLFALEILPLGHPA